MTVVTYFSSDSHFTTCGSVLWHTLAPAWAPTSIIFRSTHTHTPWVLTGFGFQPHLTFRESSMAGVGLKA